MAERYVVEIRKAADGPWEDSGDSYAEPQLAEHQAQRYREQHGYAAQVNDTEAKPVEVVTEVPVEAPTVVAGQSEEND